MSLQNTDGQSMKAKLAASVANLERARQRQEEEQDAVPVAPFSLGCRYQDPGTGCRCGKKPWGVRVSRCEGHKGSEPNKIFGFESSSLDRI